MNENEVMEIEDVLDGIRDILLLTNWSLFKSKETIEKSLEIKALLINTKKKCDKLMEVHNNGLCQPTTANEADSQQIGPEAEGE